MSAKILSGREVRDSLVPTLRDRVFRLKTEKGIVPLLSIIQVGDRPDSTSYIGAKKRFAEKIGVLCRHLKFEESISEDEFLSAIKKENEDVAIHGIIVQLPLPAHINRENIIQAILPSKDADGLTGKCPKPSVIPATARGIRDLFRHYSIELKGKSVTVVGRSILVGKPIAELCNNEGAKVTVCHSGTIDLAKETKDSDILIVATGKPHLIGPDHVKEGQIVIDVGISKDLEGLIMGDVDFDRVSQIVSAITPVPGGVGPMTVCALFLNLLDLCE